MPPSAEFGADTDRQTDTCTHSLCLHPLGRHIHKQGNADLHSCLRCAQNWVHVKPIPCLQNKGIDFCSGTKSLNVAGCFLLASWLQQLKC